MIEQRIHLEDLIGRRVHDENGTPVGRIFEMRGDVREGELVILEFLVGPGAALTRLGMSARALIGLSTGQPKRIPWERMDLSDPKNPRLVGG